MANTEINKNDYIHACQFAIGELVEKGSSSVMLNCRSEHPTVIKWDDVMNWLEAQKNTSTD